ncbi:MAG: hypothetical protein FJ109_17020 [Deltaproteobacteria bacterium]|nr:hypothetical protein [Deltaproteobacteria bacterium]
MHIPDGILSTHVWVPLAAGGVGAVALAARAARKRLAEESVPLIGLMGAFVFALQMLNFPIAAGVSDHVVGAGLLAVIFGPSVAMLCMAAVVTIQALVFGDGGIAALGANVVNMAVLSTLTAWAVYHALKERLPNVAVVAATLLGVLAGAGGAAAWVMLSQPYGAKFLGAMVLTHFVSGMVEAAVTLAVVKTLRAAGLVPGVAKEVAR